MYRKTIDAFMNALIDPTDPHTNFSVTLFKSVYLSTEGNLPGFSSNCASMAIRKIFKNKHELDNKKVIRNLKDFSQNSNNFIKQQKELQELFSYTLK